MDILWFANIAVVFLLCVIFAGFLIPQILLIAYRKQLYDIPDERKVHKIAVPRLGGMAFTLVIFFSITLIFGCNIYFGHEDVVSYASSELLELLFSFCAIILLYIIGIADDLVGIRYTAKFFVQIVCGIMLVVGGLYINSLHGMFAVHTLPMWISAILSVVVVVFILNAINLIDGIDGLASGLSIVAFVTYGVTFWLTGEYIYSMLAFANLGVLVPFFWYNVFGKAETHTKIFMGDTGSLTIGISLCMLSFKLLQCVPTEASAGYPNPFVIAFAPLIIPCFDVIRVYFHRIRTGKSPFLPDKNHIHHKLLAVGMPQHLTMISILAASLALTFLNCVGSMYININILFLFDVLIVTGCNIYLTKRINRQ